MINSLIKYCMIQAAKNIGRGLIGAGVCAISLVVVKI